MARLYADDTNLTFSGGSLPVLQDKMAKDLREIASWLAINKLALNVLKTDSMVIGSRQRVASLEGEIALSLFNTELEKVHSVKCLGDNIDENLTSEDHMLSIRQKIARNLSRLKRIKNLTHISRSIIETYFTYCCIVWDTIGDTQMTNLHKLQLEPPT